MSKSFPFFAKAMFIEKLFVSKDSASYCSVDLVGPFAAS